MRGLARAAALWWQRRAIVQAGQRSAKLGPTGIRTGPCRGSLPPLRNMPLKSLNGLGCTLGSVRLYWSCVVAGLVIPLAGNALVNGGLLVFAHEYSFPDLIRALEFALVDFKTQNPREWYVTFDSLILLSGVDCSDIGDRRLCSRAMQSLRKRWLCRYSKRHRAWMITSKV